MAGEKNGKNKTWSLNAVTTSQSGDLQGGNMAAYRINEAIINIAR